MYVLPVAQTVKNLPTMQVTQVRFPANAAGRPFAELRRHPGRGVRGRDLGAGSQAAGARLLAFGFWFLACVREAGGARSVLRLLRARRHARAGGLAGPAGGCTCLAKAGCGHHVGAGGRHGGAGFSRSRRGPSPDAPWWSSG